MTISEAISNIDAIKPNAYSKSEKIKWLSALDGIIKAEIIYTHESGEETVFVPYDNNTDLDTVLLVPAPYDVVYRYWLESQIDYANAEYKKYNNSSAAYNSAFSAYERYYNRTHMPKECNFKFF